ncbi:MAG: hypothetical protein GY696_19930 [Gammaproteobacteria bacterium]|nr:hypothetical protein [Gammaproteobacteria bacterium]
MTEKPVKPLWNSTEILKVLPVSLSLFKKLQMLQNHLRKCQLRHRGRQQRTHHLLVDQRPGRSR